MRRHIIPPGLVNRGGAPVPVQYSFNGLRKSVMQTVTCAHCGNGKTARRHGGVLISEVCLSGDRTERDDFAGSYGGSAPDLRFGLQPVLQFIPAFSAAGLVEFIGALADLLFECVCGYWLAINLGFDPTTLIQPLGAALRFVRLCSLL